MTWKVILKLIYFLLSELPKLMEHYRKVQAENRYEDENRRIAAAILAYKSSKSRSDKLDALKELGK